MRTLHRLLLTAAFSIGMVGATGAAPTVCMSHSALVTSLGQQHQEFRHAIGLTSSGLLVEVYISQHGTWTILLTDTAGIACIAAFGDRWEFIPLPEPPEAST